MKHESQFDWRGATKTLFVALLCAFGIGIAQAAWQGPPNIPNNCPTGNVGCDSPLNVSAGSQNKVGSLGIATSSVPNANVSLEIGGTNQGFLPPRITTLNRDTLTGVPAGLTVYNTDNKRYELYDGSMWVAVATSSVAVVTGSDGPAFSSYFTVSGSSNCVGGSAGSCAGGVFAGSGVYPITFNQTAYNADPQLGGGYGYNNTTGEFKPSVPGTYMLSASSVFWESAASGNAWAALAIMKNGVEIARTISAPAAGGGPYQAITVTALASSNGTDKFTVRFLTNNPSTTWMYANNTTQGVAGNPALSATYFNGSRVGGGVNQSVQNVTAPAATDSPTFSAQKSTNLTLTGPTAAWTYVTLIFDSIVGPNGNTDPCITAGCSNGPWGYNSATGEFKPSVPGRYLITSGVYQALTNPAGYGCLALLKNGAVMTEDCNYSPNAHFDTGHISMVVDANGTTDKFTIRAGWYNTGGTFYGGNYSYFTGSRIGNPATVVQTTMNTTVSAPTGAVMFFNIANSTSGNDCPSGWTEFTQLNGRYVVGLAQGNTLATPVGSALSNQENRATGAHAHQYYWYDHSHGLSGTYSGTASVSGTVYNGVVNGTVHRAYGGNDWNTGDPTPVTVNSSGSASITLSGNTGYSGIASQYLDTTGVNGGAVPGTNAPYIQLLACQKS